jgi:hypothetical protein
MNKEMVDYHKLLLENMDENAKWLRMEVKEIGITTKDQVRNLKQFAREIHDDAQSMEDLILRGEY